MIHLEAWHVEAESLEKQRLQLIQMLRDREIDLEGFYHRMKRMETNQNLLEPDDQGWLEITPAWVAVHADWVSERVKQKKFWWKLEETWGGVDPYPPSGDGYATWRTWRFVFLGNEVNPTKDLQVGDRALAPSIPGGWPQYTKDESAFNTWFQEMLDFGREHLQLMEQRLEAQRAYE